MIIFRKKFNFNFTFISCNIFVIGLLVRGLWKLNYTGYLTFDVLLLAFICGFLASCFRLLRNCAFDENNTNYFRISIIAFLLCLVSFVITNSIDLYQHTIFGVNISQYVIHGVTLSAIFSSFKVDKFLDLIEIFTWEKQTMTGVPYKGTVETTFYPMNKNEGSGSEESDIDRSISYAPPLHTEEEINTARKLFFKSVDLTEFEPMSIDQIDKNNSIALSRGVITQEDFDKEKSDTLDMRKQVRELNSRTLGIKNLTSRYYDTLLGRTVNFYPKPEDLPILKDAANRLGLAPGYADWDRSYINVLNLRDTTSLTDTAITSHENKLKEMDAKLKTSYELAYNRSKPSN